DTFDRSAATRGEYRRWQARAVALARTRAALWGCGAPTAEGGDEMRQWLGIALLALGVAVWPPATHAPMDQCTMSLGATPVEVAPPRAILEPRQPATLTLTLRNAQTGDLVGDLRLAHQRLAHLVVVSEDLAYFDHVHPDPAGRGVFRLSYTFPAAGTYYLYHAVTSSPPGAPTPPPSAGAPRTAPPP